MNMNIIIYLIQSNINNYVSTENNIKRKRGNQRTVSLYDGVTNAITAD